MDTTLPIVFGDDPLYAGSERYQQARRGVPYPRGTRAQRRRTATARVQARRRKARAAVAAMRLYLGEWFQARIQKRLDAFVGAAYPGVDSVPAGPYDPPVLSPGYTATCVVTYV